MSNIKDKLAAQWKDAVNLILGVWLIISPWILGFVTDYTPIWDAWVIGVVIAIAALAALISFNQWEEWVNAVLGVWLVLSPFILGFAHQTYATWNNVVVGVIVAILALWSAMALPETANPARSK
jgi:predicted ferric reductase